MRFFLEVIICIHLLGALPAFAQTVSSKDPMAYSLKTYGFMLGVSIIGGLVSFYARVKRGEAHYTNVMQLIGELCTSAFAGLITFWVCEWRDVPPILTAPIVGIAGHLGARAITMFEDYATRHAQSRMPKNEG
jgi:LydA holin phage, holin superfamily III